MRTEWDYEGINRDLHRTGPDFFAGFSIVPHVGKIAALVEKHKPRALLDYGSGKGRQYSELNVQQHWGGLKPHLYDIGIPKLATPPDRKFGGVICTDVLEHVAEEDLQMVLAHLFSFPQLFIFISICTIPSKKTDKDGNNLHLTVQPSEWWEVLIGHYRDRRSFLDIEVVYTGA
jgi:hypothetical protein